MSALYVNIIYHITHQALQIPLIWLSQLQPSHRFKSSVPDIKRVVDHNQIKCNKTLWLLFLKLSTHMQYFNSHEIFRSTVLGFHTGLSNGCHSFQGTQVTTLIKTGNGNDKIEAHKRHLQTYLTPQKITANWCACSSWDPNQYDTLHALFSGNHQISTSIILTG